ncbi:amino acid permease [Clostridium ljungdahlii]|uniref:amino acid permease n=1 Tax=Clostridium ljungdahlii TaxID=1538 RepID=UPI00386C772E
MIFYIGADICNCNVYPWNKISVLVAAFVLTFAKIGISAAAGIVNFVVLTAAMSGCNSGIYSCGRMLYTLSKNGQAPKFGKVTKDGVPANAIKVTLACLLACVALNYIC